DFRRLWGSSWVRRRLQGSQVVGAASAAKAEKRVSATSVVAGTISYGYGEARERGVDCKAVRLWAQRRLPMRKSADFLLLWATSYARHRLQGGQVVCAASGSKAEKHVGATSVVAGTISYGYGQDPILYGYGAARERGVDGKADSSWAQPISYGYGQARERGVDRKADSSWAQPISDGYGVARERGGDGKADSSWAQRQLSLVKLFQRKFQIKTDPISYGYGQARERGGDGKADSSWAQPISDGYGVARERGGDGKADSSWAQPISDGYGVARERGGDGKAGQLVGAASRQGDVGATDFRTAGGEARERGGDGKGGQLPRGAASAAKAEKRVGATSVVAGTISDGYGVARERGGDGKADSSWAQPISDGYGVARERSGDGKADSSWAQRQLPRRKRA
ncbi:hypothetical protein GN958_ATG19991, partial [Phytophthora infestans]